MKLAQSPRLFLFFDYDGTLAPIAKTPALAHLPEMVKTQFRRLKRLRGIQVAVVSGRSLMDLIKMVGIKKGICYSGNHGLEIFNGHRTWVHPKAKKTVLLLSQLYQDLKRKCERLDGVLVENKRLSLALHHRLAKKSTARKLLSLLKQCLRNRTAARKKLKISTGKKVWELKPQIKWNKGKAILHLLKIQGRKKNDLALFVGDDTTDEEAFKTLGRKAVTVRVAPKGRTYAAYQLRSPREVRKCLAELYRMRTVYYERTYTR